MISKTIINKRGSYILEASITLPFFIISMIIIYSLVLMYHTIENANFIIARELRYSAAEAIYNDAYSMLPIKIKNEVCKDNDLVSRLDLEEYAFRESRFNQDELIAIKYNMHLEFDNSINVLSEASYKLSLVTRAYVGKERELDNMSIDEMLADASAVYVFPKRGEKYHVKGCSFLKASSRSCALSKEIEGKYNTCPVCHSKNAKLGDLCYYFPNDGESYHLPNCPTLTKNYIELEKRVAVKRGYTACSKCGG